jgi:hypothetical protein
MFKFVELYTKFSFIVRFLIQLKQINQHRLAGSLRKTRQVRCWPGKLRNADQGPRASGRLDFHWSEGGRMDYTGKVASAQEIRAQVQADHSLILVSRM